MAIVVIVGLLVAGASAVTDARSGRIPNGLTLPLLVAAPVLHLLSGGLPELLASAAGIAVCGAIPMFLFHRGAMGGGDMKLFAALGAALGSASGLEVQTVAYVAAAFYSGMILMRRGALGFVLVSAFQLLIRTRQSVNTVDTHAHGPNVVRLGVFIFLACVISVVHTAFGGS